jgi:uncharacterized protein (DUF983 family)
MWPDTRLIKTALACKCPKCGQGDLYESPFDMVLRDHCPVCGLDLAKNDSADGPAVFLIFILGFLLVPLALLADHWFSPPLWLHGILWGVVGLGLILLSLKPLKAYIVALQYKHLPWDNT